MHDQVSVVIPCYNCAHLLCEAIESALGQTYPQVEVIVVNDGSSDNTDDIVKPYLNRITYIKQENRGLSAARNTGFHASSGEFVCFLDADDILLPDKFERQLTVFDQEPDLGLVISGYIDVEEDGQTESRIIKKYWRRDALDHLLNHEVFPPHAALIRRKVLEASSLFPEDIDTSESQEDWQLWLDLALNGVQFSSIPEPTCKYRHRPRSISANLLIHLDGAKRVVNWLRNDPRTLLIRNKVEHLAAIIELERTARAYQTGQFEEAAVIFSHAVKTWPWFWQQPAHMLRLFTTTLTLAEQKLWTEKNDHTFFEQRLIKEMLPLLIARSLTFEDLLSSKDVNRLQATAYLMLADLAYGLYDHKICRQALGQALRSSVWLCVSRPGRASTLRALLGPDLGGALARLMKNRKGMIQE